MLRFCLGPTCISICILQYKLLSCSGSCNSKRFYTFPIFVAKRDSKSRFLTSKTVFSFVFVCFDVYFDLYFTIQTTHLHCFLEFHVFLKLFVCTVKHDSKQALAPVIAMASLAFCKRKTHFDMRFAEENAKANISSFLLRLS